MKTWALVLLLPALLGGVPVIDRPVVDERGLLSSSDTEAVASELVRLRDETGAQMAVLLIGTTGGEPIEDYAMRAAEAWKGGRAGQDDGLLFVLAVDDRRARLEVGYGMEEYLPDDAVRRILDAQGPLLRQDDYRGAVLGVIQGVHERLPSAEGVPALSASKPLSPAQVNNIMLGQIGMGIVGGILLGCCVGLWRERLGSWRLAGCIGALLLVPPAITVLLVNSGRIPTFHFPLAYVVFAAMFFVVTLGAQYQSLRVAFVLGLSATAGCLVSLSDYHSTNVLKMLFDAGKSFSLLAVGLLFVTYPPVFRILIEILFFFLNSSSTYSSSSSSSWGSSSSSGGSSSSGSSSGSSWGGGGGSFGGGGASSSW
ncbi:TPM domain-containing protein [Archangium lansingense]|uniref:TPM domain-containing protein n=1 Tax=Archangium lansingense TaxID=2995310 RepID=A0ABT4A6M1_9BACT|nr:TPM domain-containing protein [Archangium lansinium]MCY1077308.1 TPM domain-containing protein [Archangium lansinium]